MISVSFWLNISKILLDLPRKMLRIAVQMGLNQYRRLVLCVSLAFSLLTLNSLIIAHRQNNVSDIRMTSERRGVHLFEHACVYERIRYFNIHVRFSVF